MNSLACTGFSKIRALFLLFILWFGVCSTAFGLGVASRRGAQYIYRDDALGVDIRVIIPDTNPNFVVRGAILDGGSNQGDVNEMAFASRFGFAIGGINGPSNTYSSGVAAAVIAAFKAWSELDNGARPEFARIPFITTGCSAGGKAAYGIGMYAWKRTLCMGINVSAGYEPANPSDSQIRVPAMFTVGELDPLVASANAFCDQLIRNVRARGGLWSEAYVWGMSHETRRINHMFAAFYEHCIRQCYPATINPRTDSVILVRPSEASGWLAPQQSVLASNFTPISPYNSFTGNKATASWLLDEEIARLYRSYTSTDIRLSFSTPDTFAWSGVAPGGGPLNGPYWWAMCVYKPGETIELVIKDSIRIPGWTRIELYDGNKLIDSITPLQPRRFSVVAADTPVVHAFTLLAYDNTTRVYPSVLYSVIVSTWEPTYDPPSSTAILPSLTTIVPRELRVMPNAKPTICTLNGRLLHRHDVSWAQVLGPSVKRTHDGGTLQLLTTLTME